MAFHAKLIQYSSVMLPAPSYIPTPLYGTTQYSCLLLPYSILVSIGYIVTLNRLPFITRAQEIVFNSVSRL